MNTTNEQSAMKALWAQTKGSITVRECVIVEKNGKADILPWPANAAEALATLKTYGGP